MNHERPRHNQGPTELTDLWKHSRVYVLAEIINRTAGLILIPVYAKFLTLQEFGVYATVTVLTELFAIVLHIGMDTAFFRVFFASDDGAQQHKVVSTVLLSACGIYISFMCLSYPIAWTGSFFLFGNDNYTEIIVIALGGCVLTNLFSLAQYFYYARKRSWALCCSALAKSVLLTSLNVYFIIYLHYGAAGIFLGLLITFAVLAPVLVALALAECGMCFSPAILRRLARIGTPVVPAAFLDAASEMVGRYLLNALLSTTAVGVYALGARLAQLSHMFVAMPFVQIWIVRRHQAGASSRENEELSSAFVLFASVMTGAALSLAVLAPDIIRIVATPAFADANLCMPFLAVGYVAIALRKNDEIDIVRSEQTSLFARISSMNLITSIVLNLMLIYTAGIVGAAIAFMMAHCIRLGQLWMWSRSLRRLEPRLSVRKMAMLFGFASLSYGAAQLVIPIDGSPMATAWRITTLIVFALAVFVSPILDDRARSALVGAIRAREPPSFSQQPQDPNTSGK
jgi:O-antigen/teichoic acid export membrane protein